MTYDIEKMKRMADNLENYLNILDNYVIIEGITKDEYDEAVKRVKKLIKKLRKGEGDKVFNKEIYAELESEGKLDV